MQFGLGDDASATGLLVGTVSFSATSEQALAPNHIGCDVGIAIYNAKKTISVDGIIKTKGTGLLGSIGTGIVLANTTTSTRTRLAEGLGETPVSNSGIIVTGNTISPTATGMEGGSIEGVFLPSVATNAAVTLT